MRIRSSVPRPAPAAGCSKRRRPSALLLLASLLCALLTPAAAIAREHGARIVGDEDTLTIKARALRERFAQADEPVAHAQAELFGPDREPARIRRRVLRRELRRQEEKLEEERRARLAAKRKARRRR